MAPRSILQAHHDAVRYSSGGEGEEREYGPGNETAPRPAAFGAAQRAHAEGALLGCETRDELRRRVEVDEQERAEEPEEGQDWEEEKGGCKYTMEKEIFG